MGHIGLAAHRGAQHPGAPPSSPPTSSRYAEAPKRWSRPTRPISLRLNRKCAKMMV